MNTGKLLIGVLAGMAAGAALGLLFAPDTGSNTRKGLTKKGEEYLSDLEDKYEDLVDVLIGAFSKAKEDASSYEKKAESKVNEYKSQLHSSIQETADRLS